MSGRNEHSCGYAHALVHIVVLVPALFIFIISFLENHYQPRSDLQEWLMPVGRERLQITQPFGAHAASVIHLFLLLGSLTDLLLEHGITHDAEHPWLLMGAAGRCACSGNDLLDQFQGHLFLTEFPYRSALLHQCVELTRTAQHFGRSVWRERMGDLWIYRLHDLVKCIMEQILFPTFVAQMTPKDRMRIAVLASGSGTNAQRLIEYFRDHALGEVVLIGTDQPGAGVIQRAWDLGVPCFLFNGRDLREGIVLQELTSLKIGVVVLAGFLRLIPIEMVRAFEGRIVNIHPALLPKYGGKGMYGANVHKAVIDSGERMSGITIHLVNEHYDEGEQLLQIECPIEEGDTPEMLAARIHELEHAHFPIAVERLIEKLGPAGSRAEDPR